MRFAVYGLSAGNCRSRRAGSSKAAMVSRCSSHTPEARAARGGRRGVGQLTRRRKADPEAAFSDLPDQCGDRRLSYGKASASHAWEA